jgi:D-alanine-D-alanine ligase
MPASIEFLSLEHAESRLPRIALHTRIAVLCGGRSSEREVSHRSGKNCYDALKRLGYHNVKLVEADEHIAEALLELDVQLAFLAMHGETGEDGAIQGLLEILGIPYTGNRIQASAITMDKSRTKELLRANGLPVLPSKTFFWHPDEGADFRFLEELMQDIGLPMMVKPLNTGSSVGMSKVEHMDELVDALDLASRHGGMVMVEAFATGKELTVGVINVDGTPTVTPILEMRVKSGWYDTHAKYTPGMTEFILPASISQVETEQVQATTLAIHQALGCHGVSRTDFIIAPTGEYYALEVNSIPGMTDLSDLPAQCAHMGVGYDELVQHILHTAVHTPAMVAQFAHQSCGVAV